MGKFKVGQRVTKNGTTFIVVGYYHNGEREYCYVAFPDRLANILPTEDYLLEPLVFQIPADPLPAEKVVEGQKVWVKSIIDGGYEGGEIEIVSRFISAKDVFEREDD